jgi:hypothetical protein
MSQGVLPFKYEEEKHTTGMTALAGLPAYLDLMHVIGLSKSVERHLNVRDGGQGWTDAQMIGSLILLNLAGGDCVEDLRKLEKDEGFCRVLRYVELTGLKHRERRQIERRWRKARRRSVPSPSAAFRYLHAFHNSDEEEKRRPGKAFIPLPNEHLQGFSRINRDLMSEAQRVRPQKTATLDMDATVVETYKREALFSYKGCKAYQPFNVWWFEQAMVAHTEFRDGNVPAGHEQLRVLQETLDLLPEGIEEVRLRSDTAGYQHNLLRYCEEGQSKRFGRIEFATGCTVTSAFKKAVSEVEEADWTPLYKEINGRRFQTGREWAEVCFVPDAIGKSKKDPAYRYLATRELLAQSDLPGMEIQQELPFPTITMDSSRYKIFGIVTNMDREGEELVNWLYRRCGKSEEAHAVMKDDLAGGTLPSGRFGENAAWWWIMILALNLNSIMKRIILNESWASKRMKAMRFSLINLPGRVLERSRSLIIRLTKGHPLLDILLDARRRIMELAGDPLPSG